MPLRLPTVVSDQPRYYYPDTTYFRENTPQGLDKLAGYAWASTYNRLTGPIVQRRFLVPLEGPYHYSPYGGGLVQEALADGHADDVTGRYNQALVVTPGRAVLGFGAMDEYNVRMLFQNEGDDELLTKLNGIMRDLNNEAGMSSSPKPTIPILMAGASAPIMWGKGDFFLWTAGVDTTPLPIETHLRREHVVELRDFMKAELAKGTAKEKVLAQTKARLLEMRSAIFTETVHNVIRNFGFVNIEDETGELAYKQVRDLQNAKTGSAVWSDDIQGTGVVAAATLLGWAEHSGRMNSRLEAEEISRENFDAGIAKPDFPLRGQKVVLLGSGAGAYGVYSELINHGVLPADITVFDTGAKKEGRKDSIPRLLYPSREDLQGDKADKIKKIMAVGTEYKDEYSEAPQKGYEMATANADVLINLADMKFFTRDRQLTDKVIRGMKPNGIVMALTNPEPGIDPTWLKEVAPDMYFSSGNQTLPNPANNFAVFGYIGLGSLLSRATHVTDAMTRAAAWGIFEVAKKGPSDEVKDFLPEDRQTFGPGWLVANADNMDLIRHEAGAVAMAALLSGASQMVDGELTETDIQTFKVWLDDELTKREELVRELRADSINNRDVYLRRHYAKNFAPFDWDFRKAGKVERIWTVSPDVPLNYFKDFAKRAGVKDARFNRYINEAGQVSSTVLTQLFTELASYTQGNDLWSIIQRREMELLIKITRVSPALGAALALRKLSAYAHPENLQRHPTVFHKGGVEELVHDVIPEADKDIGRFKGWVDGHEFKPVHPLMQAASPSTAGTSSALALLLAAGATALSGVSTQAQAHEIIPPAPTPIVEKMRAAPVERVQPVIQEAAAEDLVTVNLSPAVETDIWNGDVGLNVGDALSENSNDQPVVDLPAVPSNAWTVPGLIAAAYNPLSIAGVAGPMASAFSMARF